MIIHGNKRGGSRDLALHLLKEENDHVDVHELRGFMSDDLETALKEAYTVSKATQAKKFLFSVSFNPPQGEKVSTKAFEDAIAKVEKEFELERQARAIVFHEKNGRRHCHVVWSLIDPKAMKAIKLDYSKRRMMGISRCLFLEHGWEMPKGMIDQRNRDSRNFTLAQWQQAKRIGKDPSKIKQDFQECWVLSDNRSSFEQALKERGYILARGDRRGYVVLDHRCEIFALGKKWMDAPVIDIHAKVGDKARLPSVEETRRRIAKDMRNHLMGLRENQSAAIKERMSLINNQLETLISSQQQERKSLQKKQDQRWWVETQKRQARYTRGLKGLIDRVTGKHRRLKKQNEHDTYLAMQRDKHEKDQLIYMHLEQRQSLKRRHERLDGFSQNRNNKIDGDIEQYKEIQEQERYMFEHQNVISIKATIKRPSLER